MLGLGRISCKDYQLIKKVGEGRYAVCYLSQLKNGEQVIIKHFRKKMFVKNIKKNYFEAVILSKLCHPAIPEFLGVINDKGFYGFILEYKKGQTLETLLFKQKRKFLLQESLHIMLELIKIIRYLHQNGVVHRDIRIANIILNDDNICLIDYGLSRWADHKAYPFDLDFSYLGDVFLYLLYSNFEVRERKKPWYDELILTDAQKIFIMRLLRVQSPYYDILEVEKAFVCAFLGYANKY